MFRVTLKKLREDAGLSQAKLAEKLGVSQSAVGMWENGRKEEQALLMEGKQHEAYQIEHARTQTALRPCAERCRRRSGAAPKDDLY